LAVINGVAAAPFLVVVMWVSSSQRLMGRLREPQGGQDPRVAHGNDHGCRSDRHVRHRRYQYLPDPVSMTFQVWETQEPKVDQSGEATEG
jgi:hypothetical protein